MGCTRFIGIFVLTIFFCFMIPVPTDIKVYVLSGFCIGAIIGMLFFVENEEEDQSTIDDTPKGGKIAR